MVRSRVTACRSQDDKVDTKRLMSTTAVNAMKAVAPTTRTPLKTALILPLGMMGRSVQINTLAARPDGLSRGGGDDQ